MVNTGHMNGNNNRNGDKDHPLPEHKENYSGPERRYYIGPERREPPYRYEMRVQPSSDWWGKVTMPFVLAIVLQAGGIVWWASKLSADVNAVKTQFAAIQQDMVEDLERHSKFNSEHHNQLMQLIVSTQEDIKDNRALIVGHLQDVARKSGDAGFYLNNYPDSLQKQQ